MGTARQIVTDAFKLIGVYQKSEALEGDEGADGLRALNLLIGSWDNQTLTQHMIRQISHGLTSGTQQYAIGKGGVFKEQSGTASAGTTTTITLPSTASAIDRYYEGFELVTDGGTGSGQRRTIIDYVGSTKVATVATWDTTPDNTTTEYIEVKRPLKVSHAFTRDANNLDSRIDIIDNDDWTRIYQKDIASTYPVVLYYRPDSPLGEINLYPSPGSGLTLYLEVWDQLTLFASLESILSFPSGYERALIYNLAVDIAPQFGLEASPTVQRMAVKSLADIKSTNIRIPTLRSDLPSFRGSGGGSWKERFFSGR